MIICSNGVNKAKNIWTRTGFKREYRQNAPFEKTGTVPIHILFNYFVFQFFTAVADTYCAHLCVITFPYLDSCSILLIWVVPSSGYYTVYSIHVLILFLVTLLMLFPFLSCCSRISPHCRRCTVLYNILYNVHHQLVSRARTLFVDFLLLLEDETPSRRLRE